MTDHDKERLRALRGILSWSLIGLWIAVWWLRLDEVKRAALAGGCPPTLLGGINDYFFGRGASCRGAADSDFIGHMIEVVFVSPLGFVIGNYLAKAFIIATNAYESHRREQLEREREQSNRAANANAIAVISQKAEQQEQQTRSVNDRYELITRLGAVDDQLIVLAAEKDAERISLIHLNIAQAIRDIHAKFTPEQLQVLSSADATIAARVARTLAEMARLGLAESRHYADLHTLFVGND